MSSFYNTLSFKCKVNSEYIQFIENKYLYRLYDVHKEFYYFRDVPQFREYKEEEAQRKKNEFVKEYMEEKEKKQKEYELLPMNYKVLIDIWSDLDIGNNFYIYSLDGNEFSCQIYRYKNINNGNLKDKYEEFMKNIIVSISPDITYCNISSDNYDYSDYCYSDFELRGFKFNLYDKIKYIEHIYNEEKTEIYSTQVFYKHSIKKINFLDLNREYGV
jgi:hypothetical protein